MYNSGPEFVQWNNAAQCPWGIWRSLIMNVTSAKIFQYLEVRTIGSQSPLQKEVIVLFQITSILVRMWFRDYWKRIWCQITSGVCGGRNDLVIEFAPEKFTNFCLNAFKIFSRWFLRSLEDNVKKIHRYTKRCRMDLVVHDRLNHFF